MPDSLLRAQFLRNRRHLRRSVAPALTRQRTAAKPLSVPAIRQCENGCEMPPASPILPNCAKFRPTPLEALLRREAVFAQPFHPPTLVSRSTAVSHRPLLQWEENSSEPAHHSYRLTTAAQLFEEFRDQIASHRRAVSRRGSNVINRLDRSGFHSS